MQIRGATGEVRWAYLAAAVFGPWRLETEPGGARLEGQLVSQDGYRLAQEPLTAVVHIGRQKLVYPVISLHVDGGQLSAQLGPQQKETRP